MDVKAMSEHDMDRLDGNLISPANVKEWFPQLEHREACRLLWEWKARSNGRHLDVSRADLEALLVDLQTS